MLGFCLVLLRRIDAVPALAALVAPAASGSGRSRLQLHTARVMPTHICLGLMDVLGRFRVYLLTVLVFIISSFIMIVPVNLATTVADPGFISYLGLASADVRMDLRNTAGDMRGRFDEASRGVAADPQVAASTGLATAGYDVLADGEWSPIQIENGDHTAFPISYLDGTAPTGPGEIALSWAWANDLDLDLGGVLEVRDPTDGSSHHLTVTGVYQDMTNGGRTAKGALPADSGRPLWYVIVVDLVEGTDATAVAATWAEAYSPARVTESSAFVDQALGETTRQIRLAAVVATVVAAALAAIMTALFTQMLLARDRAPITIQTALGAPLSGIRVQYLTRMWVVLALGVVVGTLSANLLGPGLVSTVTRMLGASRLQFTVEPWLAYLACPALLFLCVGAAALVATATIRRHPIAALNVD